MLVVIKKTKPTEGNAMNQFITKYADKVKGVLSGFDRLRFKGTLRALHYGEGMQAYLHHARVLRKDFGQHVEAVSKRIRGAAEQWAHAAGRPVEYLASCLTNKEQRARAIAQRDGITEGPVCAFGCVESCQSFEVRRDPADGQLRVVACPRRCVHVYHYFIHPEFGFGYARLQTWFPFTLWVGLNGREWLARRLDAEGVAYQRADNCFPWVADFARAQTLQHEQLAVNWPDLLDGFARQLAPLHDELFACHRVSYYWTVEQSEWATDVVFNDPEFLRALYPRWVHHGLTTFQSPAVMRFLGRTAAVEHGRVPVRFAGEVVSDLKRRTEGVRIKHHLNKNSVKLYDKAYTAQGSVVRVETTINDPQDFRVFRPKEGGPDEEKAWRSLRAGVADLARRAQVSQAANERYLGALARVDSGAALATLLARVQRPVKPDDRRRVRALRPFEAEDAALLAAVSRGEFSINGFRNKDLQAVLFDGAPHDAAEVRRRSARVSRALARLRAHGVIKKVPHEYRYHLTASGRTLAAAVIAARSASVSALVQNAA
jgi:hypothetical protein